MPLWGSLFGAKSRVLHYAYRALGLDITASFPCPGFAPAVGPATGRHVTLGLGEVPLRLDDPVCRRPLLQIDAAGTALHQVPGIARYLIQDRSRVTIALEPGAGLDRALGFVKDTPFALLCHQWGLVPLKGACVAFEGRMLLIAGGAGTGKTTLALALAAHGFVPMSDHLCALEIAPGGVPVIWPAFPEMKTWRDSLEALSHPLPGEPGPGGRYTLRLDPGAEPARWPVLAVVRIQAARGGIAARVERRRGASAFEAVMNMQSLADATRGLTPGNAPAQAIARLATGTPVFEAWYPNGLHRVRDLPGWLIEGMGLPLHRLATARNIPACA
jgi:hypothetical protein